MLPRVGDVFGRELTLTVEDISEFSRLCNDFNPVHHDAAAARAAGFETVIASGTQTGALLMGETATHFSSGGASMLGLEFQLKFRRPVLAGLAHRLEWRVVEVMDKAALQGHLVKLEGTLSCADLTCVEASGTVLTRAGLTREL